MERIRICQVACAICMFLISCKSDADKACDLPQLIRSSVRKRVDYKEKVAVSIATNTDLVKDDKGKNYIYYYDDDEKPIIIEGDFIQIGYQFKISRIDCIFIACENLICIESIDSKDNELYIITDELYTTKIAPFSYKITDQEDNDKSTYDTTGISFLTPDEIFANPKLINWKRY